MESENKFIRNPEEVLPEIMKDENTTSLIFRNEEANAARIRYYQNKRKKYVKDN